VAAATLAAAETEVGRPAPEIEGEDAEGRRFKLSDHRGKVVVLSFWASWCPPCMELVPEERILVERMEGKPFVLLGINSDLTREKFREINSAKKVPWRSWWNGVNELISTQWNVETWPTLYVLDRKGVIRSGRLSFRDVREKKLDRLVELLIREE
jgi:thiol-disulfide isomerase/thioredoxin